MLIYDFGALKLLAHDLLEESYFLIPSIPSAVQQMRGCMNFLLGVVRKK